MKKKPKAKKPTSQERVLNRIWKKWYDAEFREVMKACWSAEDRGLIEEYMKGAMRAGFGAALIAIREK